ncbi:hypothetical protein C8F01DRAFT_6192, partial [Mycena amicta]
QPSKILTPVFCLRSTLASPRQAPIQKSHPVQSQEQVYAVWLLRIQVFATICGQRHSLMPVSEAQSTPETRAADRARLAKINAEIEQLTSALSALVAQRKPIQDRLDSFIYPVMTLPNEIVSEIFIQYLPPYPACPPLLGEGSPTKLAQLCRRWRNIAHSTPHLWRAIELVVCPDPELQVSLARDWLRRSRSLPLSLRLYEEDQGALSSLLEHRARWEHVVLNAQGHGIAPAPAPMPLLRTLSINSMHGSDLAFFAGPLEAPLFRVVFLNLPDESYGSLLQSPSFPWGQLTRLYLEEINLAMAARILQEACSLVDLRFYIESADDPVAMRAPVLYLLKLETLILETYTISENVTDFLQRLRLPSLRRFYFDEDLLGDYETDRITVATEVVASLTCKLRRLQISQSMNDLELYRSVFPDIPHLEVITIDSESENLLPPKIWGHWGVLES